LKYLKSFDKSYTEINELLEMPDNKIKSLITFILQNDNKLSKNKQEKYFPQLMVEEVMDIENIIDENFSD